MARRRRKEKTVEIHEFYVIRSASGSLPAICAECSTEDSIMLGPEEAAAVTHVPVRIIYRWVKAAVIHYQEAPNGSLNVCLKSLLTASDQFDEP